MAEPMILTQIRLHNAQVAFLREMGRRGGRISFDWERARPDAAAMVGDLVHRNIVVAKEYRTHESQAVAAREVELTDLGRRCLTQLDESARQAVKIEDPTPEVVLPAGREGDKGGGGQTGG